MKLRRMCSSRSALPCAGVTPPSVSRLVRSGQVASAAPRYTPASRCRPDSGSGLVGVTLAMRSARLLIVAVEMDIAPTLVVTCVLARPAHPCRTCPWSVSGGWWLWRFGKRDSGLSGPISIPACDRRSGTWRRSWCPRCCATGCRVRGPGSSPAAFWWTITSSSGAGGRATRRGPAVSPEWRTPDIGVRAARASRKTGERCDLCPMPPLDLAALRSRLPPSPITRFAPSPTGFLHLGHVANAIYVWGVARALDGRVLLRVEDHDRGRSRPEYEAAALEDLEWLRPPPP